MNITVATSIKYGNYKQLKPRVAEVKNVINHHVNICKENNEVDFTSDITVHLRPIKGNTFGRAHGLKNMIEIDPRYNDLRVVETLIHELVHIEQFLQGRLSQHFDPQCNQWLCIWNGNRYTNPTSYKAYLNLPWEIEARNRADAYLQKYLTVQLYLTNPYATTLR
jgi:hypothetical protein